MRICLPTLLEGESGEQTTMALVLIQLIMVIGCSRGWVIREEGRVEEKYEVKEQRKPQALHDAREALHAGSRRSDCVPHPCLHSLILSHSTPCIYSHPHPFARRHSHHPLTPFSPTTLVSFSFLVLYTTSFSPPHIPNDTLNHINSNV